MLIYIGNLPPSCPESQVMELFSTFGSVRSVKLISHSSEGQDKGYGFVDMPYDQEALQAIQELHETDLLGHILQVMVAKPRLKSSERTGTYKRNQQNRGYTRQF